MHTILQFNTSVFGESGQSSRLAADFARTLAASTGRALRVRDLAANPLPHLTAERITAFGRRPRAPCSLCNLPASDGGLYYAVHLHRGRGR